MSFQELQELYGMHETGEELPDARTWLIENWSDPAIGELIVGRSQKAVRSSSLDHIPDIAETLWSANMHKVPYTRLTDHNWSGGVHESDAMQRASKNVIEVRKQMPPEISVYILGKESVYVMMPTLSEGETVVLADDQEKIEDSYAANFQPFASWAYERTMTVDKQGRKSLVARASQKTLDFADIILRYGGRKVTVEKIAKSLSIEAGEEKRVLHFLSQFNDLSILFPGEPKFTAKLEVDEDLFERSNIYISEATEEELTQTAEEEAEDPVIAIYKADMAAFLSDYRDLNGLSVLRSPLKSADAREQTASDTTWAEALGQLNAAESGIYRAIGGLSELEQTDLPPVIRRVINKLRTVSEDTRKSVGQITPGFEDAICRVVNDVNTTAVIDSNSDRTREENITDFEFLWNELKNARNDAWNIFLTAEFLNERRGDLITQIPEELVDRWIQKAIELQQGYVGSGIGFSSTFATLDVVNIEEERLAKLTKVAEALAKYPPVTDPELFLIQNRVKKGDPLFDRVKEAFSEVRNAERDLVGVLINNPKHPPLPQMISLYGGTLQYNFKNVLSEGFRVQREFCLQPEGTGNMDYADVVGIEMSGNNIVPIKVDNKRYRVLPGKLNMLTDSQSGQVILNRFGLPVIYYDSEIVYQHIDGSIRNVNLVTLN